MTDEAIAELAPSVGTREASRVTGRPQANHCRRHRQSPATAQPKREPEPQPRALSTAERARVRTVLNSPEYVDKAPAAVYHELLDEGTYLASVSTNRILREHGEGARTPPPSGASSAGEARTRGHRPELGVVVGHHQAGGPGEVDVLLPVRDHRHLLSLRRRVAARRAGIRGAGGETACRHHHQAGR